MRLLLQHLSHANCELRGVIISWILDCLRTSAFKHVAQAMTSMALNHSKCQRSHHCTCKWFQNGFQWVLHVDETCLIHDCRELPSLARCNSCWCISRWLLSLHRDSAPTWLQPPPYNSQSYLVSLSTCNYSFVRPRLAAHAPHFHHKIITILT